VAAVEISPETRPNDAAVAFPLAPSHVYGAAEALREDIGVPLLPPEHTL
jgi:hypothetical protein